MAQRTIIINRGRPDERIFSYTDNAIYTTKYSIWTFVPKFLFEQFSRYANFFFFIIALIQQIPGITPISRWGTAVPLGFIIFITGAKEVMEDIRRKRADDRANNACCLVYNRPHDEHEQRQWRQVRVGDLITIKNGEEFPADLILLASSTEDQMCYIETSNIDGETSLKIRESASITINPEYLRDFTGLLKCDAPNNRIYDFEGLMIIGENEISVGPNQLLLRGSRLLNTEWIIGVAVYTGKDTKIVMNSSTTRIKRSSIELTTNRQILYLFILLLLVVLICFAAFCLVTTLYSKKIPYLYAGFELKFSKLMKKFFTFLVLTNNIVPISLIMTMEIIRIRLGTLIDSDMELYCEETDTPAIAKTTSLIEELGQVQYVFSDKTGTLTRNEMVLRRMCVHGKQINYMEEEIEVDEYPGLQQMLLLMATCNTVVVGTKPIENPVRPSYQSSSPDEVSIVQAAASIGVSLIERKLTSVTIKYSRALNSLTITMKIIAVLEFDSARKRMSIIVKDEEERIWIFSKGADTVMWPRLANSQSHEELVATQKATDEMALIGLRTLLFAYREISTKELDEWLSIWKQAQADTAKRKESTYAAMEMIECELLLCGVTGVEDRLQEAVPETIQKLHEANIRLWVLTGDKMETAISIGYSCHLLDQKTHLLQLSFPEGMESALSTYKNSLSSFESPIAALVIEAKALQTILDDEKLQKLFVETANSCRTVICCRVSPAQKAKVVEMVQKRENAVCLAIGDGANDVGMIQAAQVGIGISGKEGLQAARSADFSIAQFRFLQRLLLVHGAWGYHRISKAAIFCVYKNILLYACQIWYAFATLFSGQTIFESWMIGFYNVLFTAWPPIIIGLTDQFVTAPFLLAHPSLYKLGQDNTFYNSHTLWQSTINGFAQSLIAFALVIAVLFNGVVLYDGTEAGLIFMGTILFAGIILTGVFKAALLIK